LTPSGFTRLLKIFLGSCSFDDEALEPNALKSTIKLRRDHYAVFFGDSAIAILVTCR
jgi:hypothetical protein